MDKKETRTRTCDNCEYSGFIIGKGCLGKDCLLLEFCRYTGKIIPAYLTTPTCNNHRFFVKGGQQ